MNETSHKFDFTWNHYRVKSNLRGKTVFETHIWYNMAQNHVFSNIHNISLIIKFIWFWLCKIEFGLRYGINSHIITNHHANLSPYPILPTAMPTPYSCPRPQKRFARFASVIDAQAPCRCWAGVVALVAMVLLPLMRRHLCRCCDGGSTSILHEIATVYNQICVQKFVYKTHIWYNMLKMM